MTEPNSAVIDEIVHEGDAFGRRDAVERIERAHDGTGVATATIAAYAETLESRSDYAFDADAFLSAVSEHRTDAEWWEGTLYYEVGDEGRRLSLFPGAWHDHLGDSTDVADYVAFMQDEDPAYLDDIARGGPGEGVPQRAVVEALVLVGGVDRQTARGLIAAARDRSDVVEDADQNPEADVYLAERAPEKLR